MAQFSFSATIGNSQVNSKSISTVKGNIVIAGTSDFKNAMVKAFDELSNIVSGKRLLNDIFDKIKGKSDIVIFQDEISEVKESNPYRMSLNTVDMYYDEANGRGDSGLKCTITTKLAHELEHVRGRAAGKLTENLYPCANELPKIGKYISTTAPYGEVLAIEIENTVRRELGMELRTHYNSINVYKKKKSDTYAFLRKDSKGYTPADQRDQYNVEIEKIYVYLLNNTDNPNVTLSNKTTILMIRSDGELQYTRIPRYKPQSDVIIIKRS